MRLLTSVLLAARMIQAAAPCTLGPDRDLGDVTPGLASVRVVAFGDFGDPKNQRAQEGVAARIAAVHASRALQLGLTLGDNFYRSGVSSVRDSRYWLDIWEKDYGQKLKIPFYPTLGNHDYRGKEQAQIDYTSQCTGAFPGECSQTWKMPCDYYTFAAGPVRFFALDTDTDSSEYRAPFHFPGSWKDPPRQWLEAQLTRHASARWKVVYGHHPAYTDGEHHNQGRVREMREKLVPILKRHGVQVYISGHDHDLQYRRVDGIHYPVIGGGGRKLRDREKTEAEFYQSEHGFMVLEAGPSNAKIDIYGATPGGAALKSVTLP
ncbi:MAG: hypothetical protein FJW39_01065 [Acidobacteria bacterium]|nr:hypothetical protein [Acidobacteriota bacterium]